MKKLLVAFVVGSMLVSGASFAGVKLKAKNDQKSRITGAVINAAVGPGAKATQNVSSNKGDVSIAGDNNQNTEIKGALINAAVGPGSKAEQNVSSNEGM